ncbi:solute carrier family 12 member 9 isoform X2 [Onthophagus taurus]|uniref:solute carrier family 12 member 9 isoform X2 n=1 Tax=Onthophagus taurus TaxID=166361 RepID=UPI000C20BD04|nr:solute carrier family 12 member 9 isoform X2 [Onthophagus taurus]
MLEPSEASTNTHPTDRSPLVGTTFMKRLSNIFSKNEPRQSEGYVEFGSITEQSEQRTLGTFAGVFSPVTLSMFSALIFLRVGYVVGNAGLLVTLLQFVIAYAILVFTVASICAISTNGAVEGGGAYFMISRTLGPEFGGSIGTLFFLANLVSSALYITGCVEGLMENFGPSGYLIKGLINDGRWWQFLYCSGLNTLNLVVCLIGASMFAKTTVFILSIVCTCLGFTIFSFLYQGPMEVSLPDSNTIVGNITMGNYTGLRIATLNENLYSYYGKDYTAHGELVTFASVFGVLFSGVTGIMAGANMSGELKNPGKSIPRGTLSAIAFTFAIYLTLSLLTAFTSSRFLLQNNYLFMTGVNIVPAMVALGLFTATWSASLSNVIGGSRVIEALAKDKVFGSFLSFIPKGTWRNNPILAVVLSWLLVQLVLLIGSLNIIAQLNSVLFLLSYLATNMACLGLELSGAPNFRPSFKYFTWHTAFLGLVGTLIMMFVISPIYAACSILLCLILIIFLHLFSPTKETQWGSISQALIFHQVRKYLLMLDSRKNHVKFWRPQVLLLINSPRTSCPLIDFINDLKKGGLYVLGHVVTEDPNTNEPDAALELTPHWLNLVDHLKVKAFVELTVAPTVREGLQHLMRLSGMGAMKPNTIVLGFLDKHVSNDFLSNGDSPYLSTSFTQNIFPIKTQHNLESVEYVQMMSDVLRMNKNLCVCRNFFKLNKDKRNGTKQYIDVWPVNFILPNENDAFDTTSLFMMQLACIVNMVPMWSRAKLRVCVCDEVRQSNFSLTSTTQPKYDRLRALLKILRIEAELYPIGVWNEVIESQSNDVPAYLHNVNKMILDQSKNTAVTFIYLPSTPTHINDSSMYLDMLEVITENLPPTILVHGVSTVTSTTL